LALLKKAKEMTLRIILSFLGLWGLIGALIFNVIVVYLFWSGLVFASRTEEGHIKRKLQLKGLLTMLVFLTAVVGFIVTANYLSLVRDGILLDFLNLFLLNLGLILLLIIYDSLVIDWWVIGHWRPKFLNLPDSMDKNQMKDHIARTFIAGPILGLLLALFSTLITFYAF
jgi:hypothetical protein